MNTGFRCVFIMYVYFACSAVAHMPSIRDLGFGNHWFIFLFRATSFTKLLPKITFENHSQQIHKIMTDENQPVITTNHLWQEIPVNSHSLQTSVQTDVNSILIFYRNNITKENFNRDVNVDIHSIAGERVQARNYKIPEAIEINGDNKDSVEESSGEVIVDARLLPWYIQIDFWKLCILVFLVVSTFVVAIVLLSKNLSSSSTSDESLRNEPNDAPTSFPTYDITTLPTYEPSFKPSSQSDKEYIAMQRGILEQIYTETDGDNSWYTSENWLNDEVSVCKWHGCECNNINIDIVTSFDMPAKLNPQQVPTVIGMLIKLEVLTIDGANIVGTLPSELFHLH